MVTTERSYSLFSVPQRNGFRCLYKNDRSTWPAKTPHTIPRWDISFDSKIDEIFPCRKFWVFILLPSLVSIFLVAKLRSNKLRNESHLATKISTCFPSSAMCTRFRKFRTDFWHIDSKWPRRVKTFLLTVKVMDSQVLANQWLLHHCQHWRLLIVILTQYDVDFAEQLSRKLAFTSIMDLYPTTTEICFSITSSYPWQTSRFSFSLACFAAARCDAGAKKSIADILLGKIFWWIPQ